MYIAYEFPIGYSFATNAKSDLVIRGKIVSWKCWCSSMVFFVYIVYELLICVASVTHALSDPAIRGKIVSWKC